jgi:hypothetical protein
MKANTRSWTARIAIPLMLISLNAHGQAGWGTSQPIDNGAGASKYADIAVAPSGAAIAVWEQSGTVRSTIWANSYTPGTGWGTPVSIGSETGSATSPRVAIAANGHAAVVWQQSDWSHSEVWSNHFRPDTGWGTAKRLPTISTQVSGPRVAIDAFGNAIAVWSQQDSLDTSSSYSIFAAHSFAFYADAWSPPVLLEHSDGRAFGPKVAIDVYGKALAVWTQYDQTHNKVYSNVFHLGPGWGQPRQINKPTNNPLNEAGDPNVGVDANGNAIAVWVEADNATWPFIWAARCPSFAQGFGTNCWQDQKRLSGERKNATTPHVGVDTSGNAIALWDEGGNIVASRYAVGTGWGQSQTLQLKAGDLTLPEIAIDGQGNGQVVWRQTIGTNYNSAPYATRYAQGGWSSPAQIPSSALTTIFNPRISAAANGDAIAVWHQYDGMRFRIQASRYVTGP